MAWSKSTHSINPINLECAACDSHEGIIALIEALLGCGYIILGGGVTHFVISMTLLYADMYSKGTDH